MALSTTQETIERSLYEAIRLICVREGFTPDITLPIYQDPLTGKSAWETELNSINATKGYSIEVFGHGSSHSKGLKKSPRFAFITRRVSPGDVGVPFNPTIEPDPLSPGQFIKVQNPLKSTHLEIDLHQISITAQQERVLNAIRAEAFGNMGYVKVYNDPTQSFFQEEVSYYDLPNPSEGMEEKVYTLAIKDIYLFEGNTIQSGIVPIEEITTDIHKLDDEITDIPFESFITI